jgi:hypothetical protein
MANNITESNEKKQGKSIQSRARMMQCHMIYTKINKY